MVALAFGALWAWGMMFPVAAAEIPHDPTAQDALQAMRQMDSSGLTEQLSKRQSTNASPCKAYGIDFQDGGSYFIDQRSLQPFQAVTKFEGCQKSDADVLLVNRETTQQYNCGRIPTTPNDKPQMATCNIRESDMKSGNWSLLILGDNGLKGKPYTYQRDFALSVEPQKTLTVGKTCIYTFTEKPTSTISSIDTVATTNVIPNSLTLTKPAATEIVTITPRPSTIAATKTTTRTFTTWTRTEDKSTAVVTPQCIIPSKPMLPDPQCKIVPTIKPVPQGVNIAANQAAASKPVADRAADVQQVRKRFESLAAAEARMEAENAIGSSRPAPAPAAPTGGDQPTITVTARYPINETTTTTLPAKTIEAISTRTHTVYTTAPPKTVFLGTAMQTVYAPAATETVWAKGWTRVYDVQTMSVQWTWTSTQSVGPEATGRCRAMGGRVR